MPLWQPPILGYSAAPETHIFTPSVNSYALCFLFFGKILHFQAHFSPTWAKFQLQTQSFWRNFVPKTLVFKEKISSLDPTLEIPSIPTKKNLSTPMKYSRTVLSNLCMYCALKYCRTRWWLHRKYSSSNRFKWLCIFACSCYTYLLSLTFMNKPKDQRSPINWIGFISQPLLNWNLVLWYWKYDPHIAVFVSDHRLLKILLLNLIVSWPTCATIIFHRQLVWPSDFGLRKITVMNG